MQLAVQKNAYDGVKMLLSHSADMNIQDHKVRPFLSLLCKYMHKLPKATMQTLQCGLIHFSCPLVELDFFNTACAFAGWCYASVLSTCAFP